MEDRLIQLADRIESSTMPDVSVTVGFDAVVDKLERPVRSMDEAYRPTYFSTIGEFGQYIQKKDGLSCVIELKTVVEKTGGNMPNLATTLGRLGISTDCVGTLGLPVPDPVFVNAMGPNCRLHTAGQYGQCLALEFETGKVMLSQMGDAAELTYDQIESHIGKSQLDRLYGQAQLLGFLNWSELYHSTEIWSNVLERHVCPKGPDHTKDILIDITDCSRSTSSKLRELFEVIRKMGQFRRVTLSLNRNEAVLLGNYLALEYEQENWGQLAAAINTYAMAQCTIIHLVAGSVAATADKSYQTKGFWVRKPIITTGGGDNYNAGLVFAMLLGLNIDDAMVVANATSNFYVSMGHGPSRQELINHMRELAHREGESQ